MLPAPDTPGRTASSPCSNAWQGTKRQQQGGTVLRHRTYHTYTCDMIYIISFLSSAPAHRRTAADSCGLLQTQAAGVCRADIARTGDTVTEEALPIGAGRTAQSDGGIPVHESLTLSSGKWGGWARTHDRRIVSRIPYVHPVRPGPSVQLTYAPQSSQCVSIQPVRWSSVAEQ